MPAMAQIIMMRDMDSPPSLFDSPPHTWAESPNKLQFVSGEADGGFSVYPFNVWEKSTIDVVRDRFVRFIDRPGSKLSLNPYRRRLVFFPRIRVSGSAALPQFPTAPSPPH